MGDHVASERATKTQGTPIRKRHVLKPETPKRNHRNKRKDLNKFNNFGRLNLEGEGLPNAICHFFKPPPSLKRKANAIDC
ncbi:hypothetical protein P5673_023985 [Acropora cervicornis]|uniref:Uncharacterized protein n=1 Tax=Acropora cervicornis TaxID=6130 RepID=A0AAD9Q4C4_ACRCE|nr:hypothetical protein P5673_023985 [Acropora cervicornis]